MSNQIRLVYDFQKPIPEVFACLSNMEKFVQAHPVITAMLSTGDCNYRVYETLKLGLIPLRFTYNASVKSFPADYKVMMNAVVGKLATIKFSFVLISLAGANRIEDNIEIKAPFPINLLLRKIIRKQHIKLIRKIII